KRHVRVVQAGSSGDCLPPSPPAEKATDSQNETRQTGTRDGSWYRHRGCGIGHDCRTDVTLRRERKSPAILRKVEDFGDRECLAGREAGERYVLGAGRRVVKVDLSHQRAAADDEVVVEQPADTTDEDLIGDGEAISPATPFT